MHHSGPYITMSEAAQMLPHPPCKATMYRWSKYGIDGTILKTYKIGRQRVTTVRDMLEFVARLNELELLEEDVEDYFRAEGLDQREYDQSRTRDVCLRSSLNDQDSSLDDDDDEADGDEDPWGYEDDDESHYQPFNLNL